MINKDVKKAEKERKKQRERKKPEKKWGKHEKAWEKIRKSEKTDRAEKTRERFWFRLKFSMISTFNKIFPKRPYNLHILSLKYLYCIQ